MRAVLIILLSIALLLSLAALAFAIQNTSLVTVTFLMWRFESSLALVLLIAFALGVLVSALLFLPGLITARISARSMRQKLTFNERLASTTPASEPETESSSRENPKG